MSKTSTYSIWDSMIARCTKPQRKDFAFYGAVGITVCARWSKFANFLEDMGERPSGMSIDRIDSAKGYEPGNCRWATATEQNRNQRSNRVLLFKGQAKCVAEWAESIGISYNTLSARLRRGWPLELSLTKPVDRRFSRA